jgi:hypothetical protein
MVHGMRNVRKAQYVLTELAGWQVLDEDSAFE